MKKSEVERKRELLAEMTTAIEVPADTHLSRLLAAYAAGKDHRREIVDNVVAKYRPVLKANGPNYDGPLAADMLDAMIAAESNGRYQMLPVEPPPKMTGLFGPDDVQRCLLCGGEYRPAVEKHDCEDGK